MCCSLLRHGRDLSLPKNALTRKPLNIYNIYVCMYVYFVVRRRPLGAVDIIATAKGEGEEK